MNSRKKYLLALVLFLIVVVIFGGAVGAIWFREDDLGTIINGIVKSWEDLLKIFSTDVRNFICPVNYHRSKPNVLSGFLRPLQHLLFSLEYFCFGLNVRAFYEVHVVLHALNAVLLYFLCAHLLPLSYAFLAALVFAVSPDVSWLTWIATAQNTLSTLFMLAALLAYSQFFAGTKRAWAWFYGAGFLFFLSLLARENGIVFPLWIFAAIYLLYTELAQPRVKRFLYTLRVTWIFFAALALYWLLRLWAFGVGTLGRTLSNMLIRFPMLSQFFSVPKKKVVLAAAEPIFKSMPNLVVDTVQSRWTMFMRLFDSFFSWTGSYFSLDARQIGGKLLVVGLTAFFTYFLWKSYNKAYGVLGVFLLGVGLFCWPGFMAYPCPRYLNSIYPIVAVMIVVGLARLGRSLAERILKAATFCVLVAGIGYGVCHNCYGLRTEAAARAAYKDRFDQFFSNYTFKPGTKFVVLSSPFVSDIQSIFQTYLNDFSVVVAHEPFATLAEKGIFGCTKDYRTINVQSRIESIDGGLRFISLDPEHCGWWIKFSDHPLRWSIQDRAYVWSSDEYAINCWYPCSLGTFKINQLYDKFFLTDVSFVLDQQWFDENTVVVVWDTHNGCYKIFSSE
jgi:hypothetical protein